MTFLDTPADPYIGLCSLLIFAFDQSCLPPVMKFTTALVGVESDMKTWKPLETFSWTSDRTCDPKWGIDCGGIISSGTRNITPSDGVGGVLDVIRYETLSDVPADVRL